VIQSVPAETALLVLYLSTESPARLVAAIITPEQVYLTCQPLSLAEAHATAGGSALSWVQGTTLYLRDRVQQDPGPRVVDRDGGIFLERGLRLLLEPAAKVLAALRERGYHHLIVVPHGPFHYFPIHLLGPVGKPLSADWLVTFQPCPLAVVTADEQPRRRRTTRAAVLGIDFHDYPGEPDRFDPLEGVTEEVQFVAAAVESQPMLNGQVTRAAVADALQKARWVHIATHGLANAYAPSFDTLVLWPDETGADRLAAHELLGMDLRGLELVTLSACETALGRFDVAGNLRGLTSILLRSGARAVIGTLWPVETDTSRDFFARLYAGLGNGTAIGQAYLAAQRSTRQAHPQYRDWGAFVLLGSWTD
jgi:CHAT domain-containing protein